MPWRCAEADSRGLRPPCSEGCVARETPCVKFKLGTCLYMLAIGACVKAVADVASMGANVIELWLDQFQEVALLTLKPK